MHRDHALFNFLEDALTVVLHLLNAGNRRAEMQIAVVSAATFGKGAGTSRKRVFDALRSAFLCEAYAI